MIFGKRRPPLAGKDRVQFSLDIVLALKTLCGEGTFYLLLKREELG
jgi:hypothetical protein